MTPAERRKLLRELPDQKPDVKYTTDEAGTLVIDKAREAKPKEGK